MYETILMPLDLNETSSWEKSLPAAGDMCRISGGTLHVMTVLSVSGMNLVGQYFPEGAEDAAKAAALEEMRKLTSEIVPKKVALDHCVAEGSVHEQILATAERIGAIRSSWRHNAPASPISCSAITPTGWFAATPIRSWLCGPDQERP